MDLAKNENNLIWLDLEMTGLDPAHDRILEIATLVTDSHLRVLAEGPVVAIHQPEQILAGMDEWNREHHAAQVCSIGCGSARSMCRTPSP